MARWLDCTEGPRCVRTLSMPPNRTTCLLTRNPHNPITLQFADQVRAVAGELMAE